MRPGRTGSESPRFKLLTFTALAFLLLLFGSCGRQARADSLSAIYTHGRLALTIPYHALRSGSGRLTVELLDPEDKVLGRAEREVSMGKADGTWSLDLAPAAPLAFDDLVWECIRYRYVYAGERVAAVDQIRSVSEILRRPVIHILGQSVYLAGSQAAVRLLVSNADNQPIAGEGTVRVELLAPSGSARVLFTSRIDRRGTVDAQFRFPAGLAGSCQLHYVAETLIGTAEFTQPIHIEDRVSILLTTEKPLYQPGQTIHIRALALDRASHHAVAGPLTFEVEDSRGNKVFRKRTATDSFGIAAAEFTLADEVNPGTYHLRAVMDKPANTAEIAVNVDRYVLPKFKVSVDFTAQNGKPRRDYRPGDRVTGVLHANYFFGEPVANAPVEMKISSMDVELIESAATHGTTDRDGTYRFDLKLPSYFAGRPLQNGMAPVLVEATVKDNSGHAESRSEPVTVSQSALLVAAMPESGSLIPGLENRVYLLVSYPDGSPAAADLTVHIPNADGGASGQRIATDASGVGIVDFTPRAETVNLKIDADDRHGNRVSTTIPLQPRGGDDQILLRTDRAVYKAGESMHLDLLSTAPGGSAYIDVISNGQTLLTRDVDVLNGHASLDLDVTPEMAGTLEIDAYRFGRDAQAIGDRRLVFVQPAGDLHIDATADASVYKPGAEARIHFRVTGEHGEAVHAAIGVQIVDEAVFALAEKQPGFAKVFFYLEQELMKPRYEIHSLTAQDVLEPVPVNGAHADMDAHALFAGMEMLHPARYDAEFGRTPPAESAAFRDQYQKVFDGQVKQIAHALSAACEKSSRCQDLPHLFSRLARQEPTQFEDAWGTTLQLEPIFWLRGPEVYYRVVSAGADRQFRTGDDLSAMIAAGMQVVTDNGQPQTAAVTIEHDRGPDNGLAAIAGKVTDQSGAAVAGATVTVRIAAEPAPRIAKADAAGNFSFAGLSAGRYELRIESPGFRTAACAFDLKPRDRAVVNATLEVGAVMEAVDVVAAPPVFMGAERRLMFMPAPMAEMAVNGEGRFAAMGVSTAQLKAAPEASGASGLAAAGPHVRSYFPEALYTNPEIITDRNGEASIEIPIADSITTWRMAMLASTANGALGSATSSLKVFQDFFADLDLPVTLTQGDRVTIPVAVYNYSGANGSVELKLQPEDWYTLVDDQATKSVTVDAGQVGGTHFTLEARHIGRFKLTLSARMTGGAERRDIVVREIEVVPNGREQDAVFNGRIDGANGGTNAGAAESQTAEHTIAFPEASIPEASKILVRIYPGPLSQVVEGMDSLLRMPFGCFEQTSSSTYPNVLALDYMKRTGKLTPEIHAKAEGYIATGYQRLLTFEVPGGGFSWFGNPPANKILTAYGLMEFNDMSKVYDVDPRLIERTRAWLIAQQQPDGSWKPDTAFINEGATNRYNSDLVRITAYIAWALEDTGYRGPALEKAAQFLAEQTGSGSGARDAYTLAVLANFAVEHDKDDAFARHALEMLLDARQEKDNFVWWTAPETGVFATGESAAIETTGLAVQALLKWHQSLDVARKALAYIASKKEANGTWGTTQATIMALRALLMASEEGSSDVLGAVAIALNGKTAATLQLTPENNDLYQQFVLSGVDQAGPNRVQIHFTGTGSLAYQVVGRSFLPWPTKQPQEPLSIQVAYDRTQLAQNDMVAATATVENNLKATANMVMVDLGIPPGFDLESEDLQDLVASSAGAPTGRLEKFSLTATQAILYFNALAPGSQTRIRFHLRAKYPIRARTFESKVYEYYDPAVSSTAAPAEFDVTAR